MKTDLYNSALDLLSAIKNDEDKLLKVISFLEEQILDEQRREENDMLPKEYEEIITEIADAIDTGTVCYLNPETMEIEQVENRTIFNPEDYDEQNDDMLDEFGMSHQNWDQIIRFEPLERDEVYRIMENFTMQINDAVLERQLEDALSSDSPMNDFIREISRNKKNDEWTSYKKQETVNYVKFKLQNEMRLR